MGKEAIEGIITVSTAIVGVAIIAVLVSRNANTAGVLTAGGNALGQALTAATGPVTATTTSSIGWTGGAPLDFGSH
jgi:hypothetical protein